MMKRTLAIIILATTLSACGSRSQAAAPAPPTQAGVPAAEATLAQEPTAAPAEATETEAQEEAATEGPTEVPAAAVEDASSQPEEVLVNPKLNLNEATGEDFQAAIPNFGDRMVREFLEYRPYVSIQQFRQEIGKYVDEAQVAAYEQYVYVPVNVDEADAETLQQIPGVDEAVAAELIAARPYGSNETFLAKLAEYVSDAELAVAGSYLVSQ